MSNKKTIFFKSKYKKYAKIVNLKSISEAKKSISKLKVELNLAKTRSKKLRIKRVMILAANRAKVIGRNNHISNKIRKEKLLIANLYINTYKKIKL